MTTIQNHSTALWVFLAAISAAAWLGCSNGDGASATGDDGHVATEHHEGEAHDDEEQHHDDGVVELSQAAIDRVGLTTVPALLQPLAQRSATTGTVGFDERRVAHVGSRVSGRLVQVPAELGANVREGQTLAIVDSMELGHARADYLRAKARQEVAQRRFERERELYEDRISSEAEMLEAEAQAREANADLSSARENLYLLGLSEQQVEALSWTQAGAAHVTVRAPFAGRVVAKEATRGELVDPEDVLFTIADLGQVWVWIDIYERDLRHVRVGEAVEVQLDAWPGERFTGEMAYLADEVDPTTRTLRARVDLPNPQRRLKPGMFARVHLEGTREHRGEPVLVIPREAVQRGDEEAIVFVRTAPTRFERRPVALGQTTEQWAEIVAGLSVGEEVVTTGAFLLKSQASAGQLGGHHH